MRECSEKRTQREGAPGCPSVTELGEEDIRMVGVLEVTGRQGTKEGIQSDQSAMGQG